MDERQPQTQVQGSIIGDHAKQWNDFSKHFYFLTKPFVSSPQEKSNRQKMIASVGTFWIDGLLTQSLHHTARIELCLQDRPDVLDNPWRLQVQELDRSPQALPEGTTIVEMYDRAQGELLILGEPGAGKTTLLLELTRTLLERAKNNERLPMPIVFSLSSWAEKRQTLGTWLAEELSTKYQVPRKPTGCATSFLAEQEE